MIMRKSTISIWVALGASLLFGAESYAQSTNKDFLKLMESGVSAYKRGAEDPANYEKALIDFEKAYEIQQNPDILYNMGRSYHMLGKCPEALEKYREYALRSPNDASSVKGYIEELDKQCGVVFGDVTLTCVPESATLLIDGVARETCSGTHKVEAGTHKFSFLADGYLAETRELSISQQKSKMSLTVELKSDSGVAQSTNGDPSQQPGSTAGDVVSSSNASLADASSPSTMFWSAVGASGAGVVLMIAGGGLLGSAYSNNVEINGVKRDSLYSRDDGKVIGGGVLLGLGAAAALSGIGLFIADIYLKRDASQVSVVPSIGVSPDGVAAGMTMTF